MAQLVGCCCAKCNKTIPSIVAGEFCHECGNPVHKACKTPLPDNPKSCPICGSDVNNPMAIQVRDERINEAGDLRPMPPQVALPQGGPAPLRVNKLSMKLLFGGSLCALCGVWWFIDGITGGALDAVIGGLVWKGPLLTAAGAGAAYYGYRIMTDPGPTDPNEPKVGP